MDCRFQIREACPCQAAIPLGVAGEDEHLESLSGLLQDPHHPSEPAGVGCGQHIVQDDQLPLAPYQNIRQRKPCSQVDLLALASLQGDLLDIDGVGPRRVADFVVGTLDDVIQADVVGLVGRLLVLCAEANR